MNHKAFEEKHCETATELWNLLSPTNELFKEPNKLIYRGQADSNWGLIPSVSRFFLKITESFGKYTNNPSLWINEELLELMAMAQHHGVPTRLLDWTESSYIALYFAVSSAFEKYINLLENNKDIQDEKIAIWVLNLEFKNLYDLKVLEVPKSSTIHLAAQKGLFTVHPHNGNRNSSFLVEGLEKTFTSLPETPLLKITLPINEIIEAYSLCEKIGINSTTVFPNIKGVEMGIKDTLNLWYLTDNLLR